MPYIKRDTLGAIVAVSQKANGGFEETVDADSEELASFLAQWRVGGSDLVETDLGFIRVLEDLIDLLIDKNVIRFTDLPEVARQKMQQRQHLREDLDPRLNLLFDEEDKHGFV